MILLRTESWNNSYNYGQAGDCREDTRAVSGVLTRQACTLCLNTISIKANYTSWHSTFLGQGPSGMLRRHTQFHPLLETSLSSGRAV